MTKIEWTDTTWNPVTGCTKVSAGCKHCYAERMATRLAGRCGYPAEQPFAVTLHPDRLDQPLHWRRPRRVFVNSMSDLFHKDVPDEFIAAVWARMITCQRHVFQVLTKRPERMAALVPQLFCDAFTGAPTVAPNVWLGVSVEDQATADERIPLLLQTPAAVRFVSYEPALGPADFERWLRKLAQADYDVLFSSLPPMPWVAQHLRRPADGVDWLIVGGESGPRARPCDVKWIRSAVQQCQAAKVPVFVKQLGSVVCWDGRDEPLECWPLTTYVVCVERRVLLRSAKGSDPAEWPADLRVRQWPEVGR